MNIRLVIASVSLVLLCACEKSSLEADSEQKDLIGIWQDSNVIASGWSDVYQFFPNGKFVFHTNQMDCESRNRAFSGTWRLESGQLVLEVSREDVVVGGKLVDAMGSCGTDKDIDGGVMEKHSVTPTKLIKMKISKILIDRGKNRFNEAYERKMVNVGGDKYWKFEDDPSKY